MHLQYISDQSGAHTAAIIPIGEWNEIVNKHTDLKELEETVSVSGKKRPMSAFKGMLSKDRGEELQKYVEQSRKEWDRNI